MTPLADNLLAPVIFGCSKGTNFTTSDAAQIDTFLQAMSYADGPYLNDQHKKGFESNHCFKTFDSAGNDNVLQVEQNPDGDIIVHLIPALYSNCPRISISLIRAANAPGADAMGIVSRDASARTALEHLKRFELFIRAHLQAIYKACRLECIDRTEHPIAAMSRQRASQIALFISGEAGTPITCDMPSSFSDLRVHAPAGPRARGSFIPHDLTAKRRAAWSVAKCLDVTIQDRTLSGFNLVISPIQATADAQQAGTLAVIRAAKDLPKA